MDIVAHLTKMNAPKMNAPTDMVNWAFDQRLRLRSPEDIVARCHHADWLAWYLAQTEPMLVHKAAVCCVREVAVGHSEEKPILDATTKIAQYLENQRKHYKLMTQQVGLAKVRQALQSEPVSLLINATIKLAVPTRNPVRNALEFDALGTFHDIVLHTCNVANTQSPQALRETHRHFSDLLRTFPFALTPQPVAPSIDL